MNFFFHQILQEMSHHNILKLHHAYPAFDRYYLVMELACGGELFEDLVSRNAFSESTAREVMLQLFSGVQYIHSLRIVHRVRKVTYITGLDSYKILENCPPTFPPSQTICPQVIWEVTVEPGQYGHQGWVSWESASLLSGRSRVQTPAGATLRVFK